MRRKHCFACSSGGWGRQRRFAFERGPVVVCGVVCGAVRCGVVGKHKRQNTKRGQNAKQQPLTIAVAAATSSSEIPLKSAGFAKADSSMRSKARSPCKLAVLCGSSLRLPYKSPSSIPSMVELLLRLRWLPVES